jgi:hypothetical protein
MAKIAVSTQFRHDPERQLLTKRPLMNRRMHCFGVKGNPEIEPQSGVI